MSPYFEANMEIASDVVRSYIETYDTVILLLTLSRRPSHFYVSGNCYRPQIIHSESCLTWILL